MMPLPKLTVDILDPLSIKWNEHAMSLELKIGRQGSTHLICHIKIQTFQRILLVKRGQFLQLIEYSFQRFLNFNF